MPDVQQREGHLTSSKLSPALEAHRGADGVAREDPKVAMNRKDVRIGLLADCGLDRAAYRALLTQLGFAIQVDCPLDARSAWSALRCKPDLIIVHVVGVTETAYECVKMMTRLSSDARVIVVSAAQDAASIQLWSACRINGYVLKRGGVDELVSAISAVCSGETFFSPQIREALNAARSACPSRKPVLSPRERELLPLLACGMTLREAASSMSISYKTADAHRTHLMRKLGVKGRVELARYAIREQIIDL